MADFFIDPDASTDGDGSEGSPYNTWTGKTLSAGNAYRQKCGTYALLSAALSPTGAGVTIGSYGSSGTKPIIERTQETYSAVYAVYFNQRNCTLDGLEIRATNMHAVQLHAAFQDTYGHAVRNCKIAVMQNQGTRDAKGIYLYNSASQRLRDLAITDNDIIVTGGESGIGSYPHSVEHYDWTIQRNIIHDIDAFGIHLLGTAAVTGVSGLDPYNVSVEDNTFRNIAKAAIHIDCGLKSGRICGNRCENIGSASQPNVNAIQLNWVKNSAIGNNYVDGVATSAADGVGIIIDFGWSSDTYLSANNQIYSNVVRNCPAGPGIQVWKGTNNIVVGNVVTSCRGGISVENTASTGNVVYGNTTVDNASFGLAQKNFGAAATWKNNLAWGNGTDFYYEATAALPAAADYNAYGTISAALTPGSHDVTADPLLTSDYHPTADSPCRGAGLYVRGAKHCGGHEMSVVSPDIGAMRYFAPRTSR